MGYITESSQQGFSVMNQAVLTRNEVGERAPKADAIQFNPTVTVIIIFFNPGNFLRESVASVLGQTYSNWELLLVDDGSTDGSSNLAKAYASRDPRRIRYLCHAAHKNRGRSATRNLGLAAAKGEFIAFLDADDLWVPHKLAEQIELFEANTEVDMICGTTMEWRSWANKARHGRHDRLYFPSEIKPDTKAPLSLPVNKVIEPPNAMLGFYPLGKGRSPSMSNLIVRRPLLDKIGGFEENFRGMFDDQIYLSKIYLFGKILISDRNWDYYRQHPDSCMASTKFTQRIQAREEFLHWLDIYLSTLREFDVEGLELAKRKMEDTWRNWNSRSFKRLIIRILDKFLPVPVMIFIHRVLERIRHAALSIPT